MKKIIFMLLITSVFTLPVFSSANDIHGKGHGERYGDRHGQMMGMGHMDHMNNMMDMCLEHADEMELTDEQMIKIKPLHTEMQKKHARFKADLKIAEIELKEAMEMKDFDLNKANSAVKKIGDIKTAHHLEMLKSMKEMRSILTEDQFKKMETMMPMEKGYKSPAKRMLKKQ